MSGGVEGPAASVRTRRALLVVCLLLVTHGSLFPWMFAAPASLADAWHVMTVERLWWTGRGDAIGNVLLFLPVGALGWLAGDGSARLPAARAVLVLVGSTVFAFALQVLQLWLPEREAALSDVLWNAVGTALGLPLAAVLRPAVERLARAHVLRHRVAVTMGALWLAAQCWPLMPAHSLRHAFTALRPLGRPWDGQASVVLETAFSLAVVLALAHDVRRRWTFALGLVVLALIGKLLVRQLEVTPSHLLGWGLGLVLGFAWLRDAPRATALRVVGVLALAGLLLDMLLPWQWGAQASAFHWIPLQAPLQSARVAHTLELVWAAFWLGALLLAAPAFGAGRAMAAGGLTLVMLALEITQRWSPGRLADITPVLIPAIWWLVWRRWPP